MSGPRLYVLAVALWLLIIGIFLIAGLHYDHTHHAGTRAAAGVARTYPRGGELMETFRHEDDEHDWLTVAERRGGAALVRCAPGGVEVTPEKIPEITKALYEACGQQPPTVVDLPEVTAEYRPMPGSMLKVSRLGRNVHIEWDATNGCGSSLAPADARRFAAAIVAYAEEAETEPNPAEVEELADAIKAELYPDYFRRAWAEANVIAARTALRWMNARKTTAP